MYTKSKVRQEFERVKCDKLFKPYLPWTSPQNWWKNIRWFFYSFKLAAQRIKYGYSENDLWDFGSYIIGVMASGLEEFSEKTYSYPYSQYYSKADGNGDLDLKAWQEDLRRASCNLFQSMEELEEFNYQMSKIPKGTTNGKEWQAYFKEREKITKDRYECLSKAMEWLKEHLLEIWI